VYFDCWCISKLCVCIDPALVVLFRLSGYSGLWCKTALDLSNFSFHSLLFAFVGVYRMSPPGTEQEATEISAPLKEALKRRTAARVWVDKTNNILCHALETETPDRLVILDALKKLENKICSLEEKQREVEDLLEEDKIDGCIQDAVTFLEDSDKVRLRANRVLEKLQSSEEIHTERSKVEAKLPKLSLPKFDGDFLNWSSFWDQFKAIVDKSSLPDVTKFTYLQSLLEGEPKEVILGLSLTESNYKIACELLEDRFGRKEVVIARHIQELLSLVTGTRSTTEVSALRVLQDRLQIHVRSLDSLGITMDKYGILLTPVVVSCLPEELKIEWSRTSTGKEGDLEWLLNFLDSEIRLRETSSVLCMGKPKGDSTASLFASSSEDECAVCQGDHPTKCCEELLGCSRSARNKILFSKNLCFRCFHQGTPKC